MSIIIFFIFYIFYILFYYYLYTAVSYSATCIV